MTLRTLLAREVEVVASGFCLSMFSPAAVTSSILDVEGLSVCCCSDIATNSVSMHLVSSPTYRISVLTLLNPNIAIVVGIFPNWEYLKWE